MNHNEIVEQLPLLLYDDCSPEERNTLERHLGECPSCREELERLRRFSAVVSRPMPAFRVDDRLVEEARRNLRGALATERRRPTVYHRIREWFMLPRLAPYRIALGGAFLLVAGILLGRATLIDRTTTGQQTAEGRAQINAQAVSSPAGEPRITNVRFIDADASDGSVEFTFDALTPVHIKGSINDERVQKVLTYAMLNDDNPGVRIRSVGAIADQSERLAPVDAEVQQALLKALTSDANPGVRLEALKALRNVPFNEEIKQAYLHVLMQDRNPGMRVAAINALDSARVGSGAMDEALAKILRAKMSSDDNSYVRLRAKAFLQEAKLQ